MSRHGLGEAGQALVGEGEAGVAADHPARERRLVVVLEGDVLFRARVAALRPVAVRHLVAEHRAQPDRLDRALETGERAADEGRGRVMVDEDGGPGQGGFGGADEGGEEDHLLVQGAVEPPPDALQDLPEVARVGGRAGHAAGERAVEMRVRVDEARA